MKTPTHEVYSLMKHTDDLPSQFTIVFFIILEVIICILGIIGNGLVIWISGYKLKKSVSYMWFLSLAASNFLFCVFLPFEIIYMVMKRWIFGDFMCKFLYFIFDFNMYSTIFLLVIISVDRCLVDMFPIWTQNNRTIRKSSVVILLSWILSSAVSIYPITILVVPSCHYRLYYEEFKVMVVFQYVFGFSVPFLIIIFCYIVILNLRANQRAARKKPFKVMTLLIVTFLICWLPHHINILLLFYFPLFYNINIIMYTITFTIACIYSCINPLLYILMEKKLKKKSHSLLFKIENAFDEDGQSTNQGTSNTKVLHVHLKCSD